MGLLLHLSQTIEDFSNCFKPDKEKMLFKVHQAVARIFSPAERGLSNLGSNIEVIKMEILEAPDMRTHIRSYCSTSPSTAGIRLKGAASTGSGLSRWLFLRKTTDQW
jgi:hypothetical protein